MSTAIVVLAGALLLLVLGSLHTIWVLLRYLHRNRSRCAEPARAGDRPWRPRVAVVVPCKGRSPDLLANLSSIARQRYHAMELILVTATADDEAREVFAALRRRYPRRRIKTVVAGISPHCSQQNNNQLAGVRAAGPESEVIAIVDSDGAPDRDYISRLVAPLSDARVGATSGFRWYQPARRRLPDLLRTAWNAGGFTFLVNPRTCFVWGGSMAFRRLTFERAGIAEIWGKALSDDMTLSRRLRALGLRLEFVPGCIAVSRERTDLGQLLHWTNRQTLVTRFYNPAFWLAAAIFHGLGNLLGWGLLAAGAALTLADPGRPAATLALAAGALWIAHFWLFGAVLVQVVRQLLARRTAVLGCRRVWLVLLAPLASLLQGVNSLCSLTTRRIHWAGITYEIEGQRRMRVV